MYTSTKFKDEILKQSGIVNYIFWNKCDKLYYGQTSRVFKNRTTKDHVFN